MSAAEHNNTGPKRSSAQHTPACDTEWIRVPLEQLLLLLCCLFLSSAACCCDTCACVPRPWLRVTGNLSVMGRALWVVVSNSWVCEKFKISVYRHFATSYACIRNLASENPSEHRLHSASSKRVAKTNGASKVEARIHS